jgi:hypothetical protein
MHSFQQDGTEPIEERPTLDNFVIPSAVWGTRNLLDASGEKQIPPPINLAPE